MSKTVRITMMGEFAITINGKETKPLVSRSRKGVALVEYLILNKGKDVPKQRLLNVLWSGYLYANPENALKTQVSRIRKILNEEYDGLGECIVSERGIYRWENQSQMYIDVLDIMEIFERLGRLTDEEEKRAQYEQLLKLYGGDLFLTGDIEGGEGYSAALHSEYLNAVYDYVELLMKNQEYNRIIEVCQRALVIDALDDRLYMEMMQAQVLANRIEDAMKQYRRMADVNAKYLDAPPSEEMLEFYQKMVKQGNELKFSLKTVQDELHDASIGRGAYVCDYQTFKRIFNVMNPTLDRMSCTMFLGLIMLQRPDNMKDEGQWDAVMDSLIEIMRSSLRKGDVVVRYAPDVAAALLPTVNYTTGNMVMERIRQLFFQKYPAGTIPFHYRLGEAGGRMN